MMDYLSGLLGGIGSGAGSLGAGIGSGIGSIGGGIGSGIGSIGGGIGSALGSVGGGLGAILRMAGKQPDQGQQQGQGGASPNTPTGSSGTPGSLQWNTPANSGKLSF